MDEVLFEQGGYKVLRHGRPRHDTTRHDTTRHDTTRHDTTRHDTTIVAFQSRRNSRIVAANPGTYGPPFVPPSITTSDLPADFISILCIQNGWYLDPDALLAVHAARRAVEGRIVTYGSSMGAQAAIKFADALKADFVLAISPVSTIFAPFAMRVGDKRYAEDAANLTDGNDFLSDGTVLDQQGLLFFDPWHPIDALHAARIAALTRMELVGVPFSGHPCGSMLNRLYPLRTLLNDVARGELDVAQIKARIAAGRSVQQVNAHEDDTPAAILGSDFSALPGFLDRCRANLTQIDPISMRNAAFLAHLSQYSGWPKPMVIDLLRELCDCACHPDFPWQGSQELRTTSIRDFCSELRRLGDTEFANRISADQLARGAKRPLNVQR